MPKAIAAALGKLESIGSGDALTWFRQAVDALDADLSPDEVAARLGSGWTGDEALAIAVYCAGRYADDVSEALRVAINHSGDSDSTGSMTGALLGAAGLEIPRAPLESEDAIEPMARGLLYVGIYG